MRTIELDKITYEISHDTEGGDTTLLGDFQDLLLVDLYKTMRDDAEEAYVKSVREFGGQLSAIEKSHAVTEYVHRNEIDYVNASYHRAQILKHS